MISKYRINSINECSVSDNDKRKITNLINTHDVNIMVVGPAGSGKSTLIHLIVKEYYKCHKSTNENIMIINSLQEQGIQYYRTDVKNFCQIKSSIPGFKKTLIIDNIDDIGEQHQQIFQNYIDKFDINFIATTNNINKVNHNINSRLNYLELELVTKEKMGNLYDTIYANENMQNQIAPEVRETIIMLSGKSYKKLLNNIYKIKLYGKPCTRENILKMCSNINTQYYESFIKYIIEKNYTDSLKILYTAAMNEGYSIQDILFYFYFYVKTHAAIDDIFKYELIKIITKYIAIIINNSEDELELALFTYECVNINIAI